MLRLNMFGGLTLQQDGEVHVGPAGQRRRLALLAVIAAAGKRGVTRGLVLLGATVVSACPEKSAIWVIPGSTAEQLRFGVGRSKSSESPGTWTNYVRVYRCDGPSAGSGASWLVNADTTQMPRLKQVNYGELPPGWALVEGPVQLTPGCYRAAISGTGRTEFLVQADGTVIEEEVE